jgi:hypothetical protein
VTPRRASLKRVECPILFRATPQPSTDRRSVRSKANPNTERQGIIETTGRHPKPYEHNPTRSHLHHHSEHYAWVRSWRAAIVAWFFLSTVSVLVTWHHDGVASLLYFLSWAYLVLVYWTLFHCLYRVQRPYLRPTVVLIVIAFFGLSFIAVPVYWLVYARRRSRQRAALQMSDSEPLQSQL